MAGFAPLGTTPTGALPLLGAPAVPTVHVSEAVGVVAAPDPTLVLAVRALLAANDSVVAGGDLTSTVTDTVAFGDLAYLIARLLVTEGFAVGATPAEQFTAFAIVRDALRLAGVAGGALDAHQLLIVGVATAALADLWGRESVSEALGVQADVAAALSAATRVVEGVLAGGLPSGHMVFGAVVREEVDLAGLATGGLQLHELVREAAALTLRINAEGDERVAYLLNTETKALTRFTAWPFNSYAALGQGAARRYYGMTADGIRRVFDGADSDDGAPIAARVRLAMTNLGTGALKRMQAAYLGYTATGDLFLRAVTVDPKDGQKIAYTYRLKAQAGDAMRPARIQIGQGLKSVYWGFELEAVDGARFELDTLELLPLLLDGRVQGEGGGLR